MDAAGPEISGWQCQNSLWGGQGSETEHVEHPDCLEELFLKPMNLHSLVP